MVVEAISTLWNEEGVPEAVVVCLAATCALLLFIVLRSPTPPSAGGMLLAPPALTAPRQAPTPLPKPKSHHAVYRHPALALQDVQARSKGFLELMSQRRSVRFFSKQPVPRAVVENCVRAAATSPSGAHCQPWTFVVVQSAELKHKIRLAVEAEEQRNYDRRMRRTWVADVNPLVDNLHSADGGVTKPYLDDAPFLIIVMKQVHGVDAAGNRVEHYYPAESCGIAVGMLVTALHNANLSTLTSTPMGAERAIRELCGRPDNEKVFLLLPVGFASPECTVPYRDPRTPRKPLSEAMVCL